MMELPMIERPRKVHRPGQDGFSWVPITLAGLAVLSAVIAYTVESASPPSRTAQTDMTDAAPKPSE
jgi:hypothetical protein